MLLEPAIAGGIIIASLIVITPCGNSAGPFGITQKWSLSLYSF